MGLVKYYTLLWLCMVSVSQSRSDLWSAMLSTQVCGNYLAKTDTIIDLLWSIRIWNPPCNAEDKTARRTYHHWSLVQGLLRSPGLGGIRTAGLYTLSGLLERVDTRFKTLSRVRMGLSFAWKTSLAIRILYFLPCNRLHVNPSPFRCLYKPEGFSL